MATEKQPNKKNVEFQLVPEPEEKKVIEFAYTTWANYSEVYPYFYMSDINTSGGRKIELSKEEVKGYEKFLEEYTKWQLFIEERAFPEGV